MSKKQLVLYSLALLLIFGNGSGLAALIPVHLSRTGISPDRTGFLFSMLYLGIAGSGILAGWLVDRVQHHKLLGVASAAGEILTGLFLWQARSFSGLALALFFSWVLAGIHAALVSALVGLQATENERGRVFGVIGFLSGLGPVISGLFYGRIVDAYGFNTLLILNLAISVLWTILAVFYKQPKALAQPRNEAKHQSRARLPSPFWLLAGACTLGWAVINGGRLGISLVMTDLHFSAGDISFTLGIASLVALAVPLLLGWLSDFTGRKPLLLGLNLLGLGGLYLISRGSGLAGFCAASSLLTLYSCFSGLSNALAADLLPRGRLGFGLALINSSSYVAGIFSSSLMGLSLRSMGPKTPFLAALTLPLTAAVLLAFISNKRPVPLPVHSDSETLTSDRYGSPTGTV